MLPKQTNATDICLSWCENFVILLTRRKIYNSYRTDNYFVYKIVTMAESFLGISVKNTYINK